MTITPINLGNAGGAAVPGAGAAVAGAADAGILGFANILSFQLSDISALRQISVKADETATPLPDTPLDSLSATDPAQLLAGILAMTPPATPKQEASIGKIVQQTETTLAGGKRLESAQEEVALPITDLPTEKNKDVLAREARVPSNASDLASTGRDNAAAAKFAAGVAADAQNGNFSQVLAGHSGDPRISSGRTDNTTTPAVTPPLNDSRWSQDFGEKIVWLARNDRQSAQITINPPQLGPVQINLDIKGDQATAFFVSAHGEVRQAIENALPHLREMLANAGISLGQANVGAQFARQDGGNQSQQSDSSRFADDNAILHGDSDGGTAPVAIQRGRGMVDLFA